MASPCPQALSALLRAYFPPSACTLSPVGLPWSATLAAAACTCTWLTARFIQSCQSVSLALARRCLLTTMVGRRTPLTTTPKTRHLTLSWATSPCRTSPKKLLKQAAPLSSARARHSPLTSSSTPTPPSPQVLYIFTGLQNFDWIPRHDPERQSAGFDIIQPVLQACSSPSPPLSSLSRSRVRAVSVRF